MQCPPVQVCVLHHLFSNVAELAYNNLLLRHFQPFIFSSVLRVSQLCLGLTLLLKCRVQKLGLDFRPSVPFDLFDQLILFWYVPSCVPLCESFEHMQGTSIPFHNPLKVHFFIVVKGQIDRLKYLLLL